MHDPVLFDRDEIGMVKFDIRYILLLHSVKPLQVYAYNRFWLRFANQEFELKDLDVYEKHFTVMNYKEAHLEQVRFLCIFFYLICCLFSHPLTLTGIYPFFPDVL